MKHKASTTSIKISSTHACAKTVHFLTGKDKIICHPKSCGTNYITQTRQLSCKPFHIICNFRGFACMSLWEPQSTVNNTKIFYSLDISSTKLRSPTKCKMFHVACKSLYTNVIYNCQHCCLFYFPLLS